MTRRQQGRSIGRDPRQIPAGVARKLGHYVYAYVDPFTDRVFYIGKGTGRRALDHLGGATNRKTEREIRRIRSRGAEPRVDIVVHGLPDSKMALRVEAAVIDAVGRRDLTNAVRGWGSVGYGRQALEDLLTQYHRRKVRIHEPSVLIKIPQLYRPGMPDAELYDATRGVWRIGVRRERAKYAFAVFEQVVREVYEIEAWFPAGRTFSTRSARGLAARDRWEFVGRLARRSIRKRYLGAHVGNYFRGSSSAFVYVNVDE